jgi:ParB/RepB/Spo0J family partition protein
MKIPETPTIVHLDMASIHPRRYARRTIPNRVIELAQSIQGIGLQVPITVRAKNGGGDGTSEKFEILAGCHRYAAFRILRMNTIPCIIQAVDDLRAELISIDENLCRENLTPAQEAKALARRKQIYEALNPETKHGAIGSGRNQSRQIGDSGKATRFTKVTAELTGKPERNIQRAAKRGAKIGPNRLDKLAGTSLDKGIELDALADLPAQQQDSLIERAAKGESVTARQVPAPQQDASERWRAQFSGLLAAGPTESDRAWAWEQLAATLIDRELLADIAGAGLAPEAASELVQRVLAATKPTAQ